MDKDDPITRQEMEAIIKVSGQIAEHLALIADREKGTSEILSKIAAELSNGLPKKIYDPVRTDVQQIYAKVEAVLVEQREIKAILATTQNNGVKLDTLQKTQTEMQWMTRSIAVVVGFLGLTKLAASVFGLFKP